MPLRLGGLYGMVYYHLSVLRRRHDPGFLVGTCMRWFDFLGKFGDRFQWWLLTLPKEEEKQNEPESF
jgi:hypothetical protein